MFTYQIKKKKLKLEIPKPGNAWILEVYNYITF